MRSLGFALSVVCLPKGPVSDSPHPPGTKAPVSSFEERRTDAPLIAVITYGIIVWGGDARLAAHNSYTWYQVVFFVQHVPCLPISLTMSGLSIRYTGNYG